ncbi:hypothetical protein [Nocardioides marmoraquaticus]
MSSARRAPLVDPAPVRLAPGLRVVRRGRDLLQVGLHPERRLVLPRRPGTERLLEQLGAELDDDGAGAGDAAPAAPAPLLDRLAERGLLVPSEPPPATRLGLRTSPPDASWPVELDPLLDGPSPPLRRVPSRPDAVLVLGLGEPDRTVLDPLVRDGVPHLVLTLVDGGARLGPLVVPGRTACLRCVDAHLTTDDPDHLAVLTRYAAASRAARPDDTDPVLAGLVTSWALRDLALLQRGERRPATWSATLTWHPRSGTPVTRTWLRHPGCGCGWAAYDEPGDETGGPTRASGARPSGTMEA